MEVESADMDSDMRNDNENEEEEEPRDPLADDEPAVKIEGGKNGNDEKTAKSDVSRRTRRKNASSHFLDASASENEDPGSDSDQEYKPPESKSKMKPKTQGVKRRKSETKSQVCVKPIKKLVKNNENDSLNFAPIKITSVTSLSAETKTPPKSMKPKPNFKRNTVECQVAVKYAIDNANKLAEDIRSECSKIKEAPKDTKDIIASAKELFGVLNRTKSRIEHVENTFKADIHKIFAQNNCSWYLENDSDFGVPNSSNGKSQESDSDCEIVDSATASTSFDNVPTDSSNIYHVLKKIEKQGISWKNSKTLTTSDRVLNAMANSQKPVMIGKDIVVKKIPALPKNQPMNSFFWLDGRTLKPPDSSNVTAFVMVLQDITEYIKQMMDLRPLDLNKSDIPNIVNCIDRVYVCEYVEEIVLDDADAENASDILYDDFCHAYSKLPSSETCEYTIVKKSILNASESDKLCIVSSEKCAESSRPKSLFLMCLNSMFSIYEKIVCCDSFIYNEFKTNVAIYKKHFEKIVNLRNYYTMAHFEEHLKKNLINKNILKLV